MASPTTESCVLEKEIQDLKEEKAQLEKQLYSELEDTEIRKIEDRIGWIIAERDKEDKPHRNSQQATIQLRLGEVRERDAQQKKCSHYSKTKY